MKKLFLLIVLFILIAIPVFAAEQQLFEIQQQVKSSNISEFENNIAQEVQNSNNKYIFKELNRQEDANNTKQVSVEKKEKLNTNNQEDIIKHFGETIAYNSQGYEGELKISNILIDVIDNGYHEEILDKEIIYENFTENDLYNIPKETIINNEIYYLINVEWNVESKESVDNMDVPITYNGISKYQKVGNVKNPDEYNVIVTYTGTVTKIDKLYNYTLTYENKLKNKREKGEISTNIQPKTSINNIIILSIIVVIGTAFIILFRKKKFFIKNTKKKNT